MNKLIRWVREVEHEANAIYSQAAIVFADDPQFKSFLENLAEDEAWHYHVMGSAVEYFNATPPPVAVISIDKNTDARIKKFSSDIKRALRKKTISKEELIEKIVEFEFSEWNDIFLYVVNELKEKTSEFKYPAARIQAHIKKIEYFLATVGNGSEVLKKITAVPSVWVENILIVDDEQMITDLVKALLHRSGNIDVAHNGQEALKLIEEKYYKLIISDINMPVMDGLSLYKAAVAKFPASNTRFLFMTGELSSERKAFFSENRILYLAKPIEIKLFRDIAAKIILAK